jgi:glutamine amidotransferase
VEPRKIAVIDYGTGNLRSVVKAFEHIGAEVSLSSKPRDIQNVDAVVFPGQGSFDQCITSLKDSGMDEFLKSWLREKRPFFGICLGLQVLFEKSEEGILPGLAIFSGNVVKFKFKSDLKIPHMGWNQVKWGLPFTHPIRNKIADDDQFYFVHSYHVNTTDSDLHVLTTEYESPFVSGVISGNCVATQFHPEKSQSKGIQLYRNFLENIE